MNWRCLFGHARHRVAPLYSQCVRCRQGFFTDYFASRSLGRTVLIKVSDAELQRAIGDKRAAISKATGAA